MYSPACSVNSLMVLAQQVDETTFEVTEAAKKVYRFICKDHLTAANWVTAISNISPPPPSK